MDYQDLVFNQCGNNNSNIEMKEVWIRMFGFIKPFLLQIYPCIYNKTYSLEEIQVGMFLGAGPTPKG